MGKRPKGPPIVNGPYHHHRHQDSSHMTTSRSPAVHQRLAHSRAMRFRVGQRAASRLGADLHAKRLEKLETLYPLCEGFLQKSTLTISGRTFRRTLVLSSSQTSKPPYQRHCCRLYHLHHTSIFSIYLHRKMIARRRASLAAVSASTHAKGAMLSRR